MRLWAWSHYIDRDAKGNGEVKEHYPCFDTCLDHDERSSGPSGRKMRAYLRCALPGYPESRWGPPGKATRYMGRLRILRDDDEHPKEPYDDGCPGAWYRCAFVRSLHRYHRLLTDAGFSENLLLSRSADRLLLEAIHYFEAEKLAARDYNREQSNKTR